jgi:hypothetical protein
MNRPESTMTSLENDDQAILVAPLFGLVYLTFAFAQIALLTSFVLLTDRVEQPSSSYI